jgi:transketolase
MNPPPVAVRDLIQAPPMPRTDDASPVDVDRLCIDTIRTLTIDAVERARSGHPGMPMGMAPVAYLLYSRVMRHNPRDPDWPDRDRFVLSAGHGSMLLYSVLHLSGYDLSLDDLRAFRSWGSRTPGHPERDRVHVTPGVETTTGPLGQGFANGVGMAMAERFLRERYGSEVVSHRTFGICSDGDLMEGISSEAASLAGHLGLGRLVYLYDDNHISIDGDTALTFDTEDVDARFRAYGWHVSVVQDANDLPSLETAIDEAIGDDARPSLIRVRSVIGYPAPSKAGTSAAHGSALGPDEVRATKVALGWDPELHFHVPDEVYERFDARERGAAAQADWEHRFERWRTEHPDAGEEWNVAWSGRPADGLAEALPRFDSPPGTKLATRTASGVTMQAIARFVPTMVGGSADLTDNVKTAFKTEGTYSHARAGRNVYWGVREHAMAGAVNGLALHGGIIKPYGSTFLQFADYMRPAIRLSALMKLPCVWVFSHDSLGVGEDGPTHQPVEHLAALRAIPGLTVIRPSDAAETAEAWRVMLEEVDGPAVLVLSRQDVPVLDRDELGGAEGLARGAYVLRDVTRGKARAAVVATGSEVAVALEAADALGADGIGARVVAMPSWELFAAQPAEYRDRVLPPDMAKVSVEAGVSMGWERWVDRAVAVDRFGASAPGAQVLHELGMNAEAVVAAVRSLL